MALVNMKELLKNADEGNYAVGAFNVASMEMVMGAIKACEELNSPMILQVAEVRLGWSPLYLIGPMMISAAKNSKMPVAVHFDHGQTVDKIREALKIGFTSVMIDGSKYPIEENIRITNEVIKYAKEYGAAVEAEIGRVGGSEGGEENVSIMYTNLEEAKRFYNETNIDALAVAIGNAHGVFRGKQKLNMDVLEEIDNNISIPLVLHGGTGTSDEDFKKCIKNGIRKINVATANFISVNESVKNVYRAKEDVCYNDLNLAEVEGTYNNVKRCIKLFNSENKA